MNRQTHEDLQSVARFPFGRIVVATDGGPASEHALAWARELARLGPARVWLLHVSPGLVTGATAFGIGAFATDPTEDRRILDEAQASLAVPGADGLLGYGDPTQGIVALSRDVKADLIILGTHGRSLGARVLLGSVADAVRNKARCSVLLARSPPSGRVLLAAVDGSQPAARAAQVASTLADAWRGQLVLCHIASADARLDGLPDYATSIASRHKGALTKVVKVGDPAAGILEEARARECTLIVMGDRGLGRVKRAIMGSVSTKVCHEAATSVLVVRKESP